MTIHLTKPMTLKGAEVSEPAIDFEALTGADLVAVEREVRVMGGTATPIIAASMRYQAAVAARMIGCPADDVMRCRRPTSKPLLLR